ncbi:hypothetical protein M405DRAFT_347136 [Rhizopogon salebrosus TDB-379]|nr:hypothetical protein M405DRAFT_347136 [Rhizopogon salebrosus TDB-379]
MPSDVEPTALYVIIGFVFKAVGSDSKCLSVSCIFMPYTLQGILLTVLTVRVFSLSSQLVSYCVYRMSANRSPFTSTAASSLF